MKSKIIVSALLLMLALGAYSIVDTRNESSERLPAAVANSEPIPAFDSSSRLFRGHVFSEILSYGQRIDFQCESDPADSFPWSGSFNKLRCSGGVDSVDSRYGDGRIVRYFRSPSSMLPDIRIDTPGIVLSGLLLPEGTAGSPKGKTEKFANAELSSKWYIKPRIRVDSVFMNRNYETRVCKITVLDRSGKIIDDTEIKANSFFERESPVISGLYRETFMNTVNELSAPLIISGEGIGLGDFDIQIYYYAECDMWIDYVSIENTPANGLLEDGEGSPHDIWLKQEALYLAGQGLRRGEYDVRFKIAERLKPQYVFCTEYVNRRINELLEPRQ